MTAMISDLSVQQMHTFVSVFENKSYAAAARAKGFSVPTIWEQVRTIEAVYGKVMFKKTGRRIEATEAAHQLYKVLMPILNGLESTIDIVQQDRSSHSATITLVAGVRMMLEDLAIPLKKFRSKFNDVNLRIRQGNDVTAEELVLAGNADIAFALEPNFEHSSQRLNYEAVYAIDIVAVFPREHPLASKKRLSLTDLSKHDLIVGGPATHVRQSFEDALHHRDLKANITVETDTGAFTLACVQAGMGVGLLAGKPTGLLSHNLIFKSLRRQLGKRRIMAMWKRGRILTDLQRELIAHVKNELS